MGLFDRFTDAALDASIVFSFDRTGFARHRRAFREADLDVDLSGRNCLITGANSGLGFATSMALADRGATVWMLCRDAERGGAARERIIEETGNKNIHLRLVDLADLDSVRAFADGYERARVHTLIKNAGILVDERRSSPQGFELTFATNVLGHFLLTDLLAPKLRAAEGARLITVSSGGMYTQRLNLKVLQGEVEPFDGVTAYAQTKRAQVVLNEVWAKRLEPAGVDCFAMHPGWADTPAVRTSLPRFHKVTHAILRTPEEGADTAVWLSVCRRLAGRTGEFFFDRQARTTHLLPGTQEREGDAERLLAMCEQYTGVSGG